jgi:putative tRNA adenosine deaminase-associated protein
MATEYVPDFALAAVREEGAWSVVPLPPAACDDLDHLLNVLRQQPSEAGVLGLVSVAEDFFVVVRVNAMHTRLLLSDATAAYDSPLARQVLAHLDVPMPEGESVDDMEPAGDLDLLSDLGVSAIAMSEVCADLELYPEEVLGMLAEQLGFSEQFDSAVALVA